MRFQKVRGAHDAWGGTLLARPFPAARSRSHPFDWLARALTHPFYIRMVVAGSVLSNLEVGNATTSVKYSVLDDATRRRLDETSNDQAGSILTNGRRLQSGGSTVHQTSVAFALEVGGNGSSQTYTTTYDPEKLLLDGDYAKTDGVIQSQLAPTLWAKINDQWIKARLTCEGGQYEFYSHVAMLYSISVCSNASADGSAAVTPYKMTLQVVPTANASWTAVDSNATRLHSPSYLTALVPAGAVIDFTSPAVLTRYVPAFGVWNLTLDAAGSADLDGGYISTYKWASGWADSRRDASTGYLVEPSVPSVETLAIFNETESAAHVTLDSNTPIGLHQFHLTVSQLRHQSLPISAWATICHPLPCFPCLACSPRGARQRRVATRLRRLRMTSTPLSQRTSAS